MTKTMLVLFVISILTGSSVWCQDTAQVAPPQEDAAVVPAAAAPAAVSNNSEPPALSPVIPAAEPDTPSAVPAVPATAPVIPDTVPAAPGTVPVLPDTKSAIPDAEPAVPDVPVTDAPADTTTAAPNTTTAAPNTTTSTTTTTTTTAAPTPPAPTRGIWSVLDETSTRVCVLAQMATQMKIPYLTSTNKTQTTVINIPSNASSEGSCKGNEYIRVFWPEDAAPETRNFLMMTFAENKTAGRYRVDSISVQLLLDDDNFPDHASNDNTLNMNVNFSEPITLSNNTSYRCMSKQPYQLLATDGSSGQLIMLETQLEAFRTVNTTKFSNPLVCSADHRATSDVVPIAVGVALASLVVIILIAYIVGRRRARQRGYQSV